MATQQAAGSDPFQQAGGDPWAEEATPHLEDDGEQDDGQGYGTPPDYPLPQPRTFATDDPTESSTMFRLSGMGETQRNRRIRT